MEKEEIKKLFKKYHEGKCTEEEKALLEAWYLEFNEHDLDITPRRIKAIGNRIFRELPGNQSVFVKIGLILATAAIVIGVLATLTLRFVIKPTGHAVAAVSHDIGPGANAAMLTLSSGQQINLSNAVNGKLATQPGAQIIKTATGQVIYTKTGTAENINPSALNDISTPKGGQWQVILPDGSKVWLNSASSLRYPATFEKQPNRMVSLTGEAYFEVVKDKLHPFIVVTDQQSVEVLGTHFNISSYRDDPSVTTTLAEGKIEISDRTGKTKILAPGQQALLTDSTLTVSDGNVEEAMAWKNGYFRFNDEKIQSIMRKLARWYNIDVAYDSGISTGGLNGKVSRYKNISQVLNALEATQTVHFKVEGRRVTVLK